VLNMAERAGHGDEPGVTPRRGPDLPEGRGPGLGTAASERDGHLAGFGNGGAWDTCPPSGSLALALEAASGPEGRCPGASHDELFGLLRQWQALESRAVAGKLAVLRALIREDDQPLRGGGYHGDLPEGWTKSLTHEVAAALAMPAGSADQLMWVAWNLEGRLPGVGALLRAGKLTFSKARAVDDALQQLTDADVAAAEAMILPDLPGKTYGQALKLAVRAAITVDPESATRRREDAEQHKCRVQLVREDSGAAGLSGRDMPTDQTLAAHSNVCARAQEYQESGAFGDDVRMDQYRVGAYLDLLNGIAADARIAWGVLPGTGPAADDDRRGDDPDGGAPGDEGPCGGPGTGDGGRDDASAPGVDHGSNDVDHGSVGGDSSPGDPHSDEHPGAQPTAAPPARLADLVLPLATLLGLAERPGEGHGLGPLDPDLCRRLAVAAAGSPGSRLCVTVIDSEGIAIGHGCARGARRGKSPGPASHGGLAGPVRSAWGRGPVALPARVNLTIGASQLAEMTEMTGRPTGRPAGPPIGPRGPGAWAFARDPVPGPPDGFGAWTLSLPDGRNLTVELRLVPTFECDHRYESHAYQPNDALRHLVQIRDGDCTFPPCSRHARESDFEHATPYDKGGRTCACNAGARSRSCHRIKQSPGWNVIQPKPGWHQWTTPSGRTYIQGPKRYPG
jgi:hypothetical protein